MPGRAGPANHHEIPFGTSPWQLLCGLPIEKPTTQYSRGARKTDEYDRYSYS